ncbi:MAG TPA: DUF6655 family protein [Terriglobales bacterium]|nr:DUF6655 family protein [Terriglobales bacterium]
MHHRDFTARFAAVGLKLTALALLLGGCTTIRSTDPQRTATEQLLISTAADHAAETLALDIPKDKRVFVDATNFEGYDSKYAIGTIRDHLLRAGQRLIDDRGKADVIVEIRAGALSVDDRDFLIGIPQINLPVPLAGQLSVPEIALYKRDTQQGVAKFAATAYDAKEGVLIASSRPDPAASYQQKTTVFFLFSWSKDNLRRPPENASD